MVSVVSAVEVCHFGPFTTTMRTRWLASGAPPASLARTVSTTGAFGATVVLSAVSETLVNIGSEDAIAPASGAAAAAASGAAVPPWPGRTEAVWVAPGSMDAVPSGVAGTVAAKAAVEAASVPVVNAAIVAARRGGWEVRRRAPVPDRAFEGRCRPLTNCSQSSGSQAIPRRGNACPSLYRRL
ncbi:hypothetical protein FMEAI12_4580036 [Parafrankia sp. Ea1.12]|nr:hypothetical protein FMEAI12_4580036 [Parafrankia sp. Ea1.12]